MRSAAKIGSIVALVSLGAVGTVQAISACALCMLTGAGDPCRPESGTSTVPPTPAEILTCRNCVKTACGGVCLMDPFIATFCTTWKYVTN